MSSSSIDVCMEGPFITKGKLALEHKPASVDTI